MKPRLRSFLRFCVAVLSVCPVGAQETPVLSAREAPPLQHVELERLARIFGYLGGRRQSETDTRNEEAMTIQGDAAFRQQLRLAGYDLLDSIDDKGKTGMQAMVVRNRQGQTTIVFRGTEPASDSQWVNGLVPLDLIADLEMRGNVGNKQYEAFTQKLDAWAERYPNSLVTGHSLGASLAQHYMAEHPDAVKDAALFNAPGVSMPLARQFAAAEPRPPCTIYVAKGDPVSELGGSAHIPCRIVEVTSPDVPPAGYWPSAHSFTMLDIQNDFQNLDYASYESRRGSSYDSVANWVAIAGPVGTAAVLAAPPKPSAPTPGMVAAAGQQRRRAVPGPAVWQDPDDLQENAIRAKFPGLTKRRAALMARIEERTRANQELDRSLRSGFQRLLEQIDRRKALCERAHTASQLSRADIVRIEQQSDEVENLLTRGQALLDRCQDQQAVAQAEQDLQRATQLAAEIAKANQLVSARDDAASDTTAVSEAERLRQQLRRQRAAFESRDDGIQPLRDDVDAFNRDVTTEIEPLRAGSAALADVLPRAERGRLGQTETEFHAMLIAQAALDALTQSETAVALTVRLFLPDPLSDADRSIKQLSACGSEEGGLAPELIDGIDTAYTLSGLAMTKLGPPYERSLAACRAKLDRPSPTAGTPAARTQHTAQASQAIQPPVYLLRFGPADNPNDVRFLVYERLPEQKDGVFIMSDQNGSPWRYPGEYSGPYSDSAGLCAVLRGYKQKSVAYPDQAHFISCPAEGPQSAPVNSTRAGAPPSGTAAHSVTSGGAGAAGLSVLSTTGGATVTLLPGTKFRTAVEGNTTVIHLEAGGVEVGHPPAFAGKVDVNVATLEGRAVSTATRYRVTRENATTDVEVFEGAVHLTGRALFYTFIPGQPDLPKQAPATTLDLKAGWRGRMTSAPPPSSAPSALPSWASAAAPSTPSITGADPWNDPRVQAWMDEWLRTAVPPSKSPGIVMRYNEWAQPLSQAATSTGPPDHPPDWTRYRYLWETRARWTSTRLCRLGEFLEHRLKSQPLDDCIGSLPAWSAASPAPPAPAPPPARSPIEQARQQLAQAQNAPPRPAESRPSPPNPEKPPNPPRLPDPPINPARLVGEWSCSGTLTGSSHTGYTSLTRADSPARPMTVRIVQTNQGLQVWQDGGIRFPITVTGSAVRGVYSGRGKDWNTQADYPYEATFDFTLQGDLLSGAVHYRENSTLGREYTYQYRCDKAVDKKK